MDQFTEAHLFVAAIRILEYQKQGLPTLPEVSSLLNISEEEVNLTARKLEKNTIVELHTDPFSTRVSIKDYLKIEELPREVGQEANLAKDIEQFMAEREDMDSKVKAIQAEMEQKKRDKFNAIEEQLKKQMGNLDK